MSPEVQKLVSAAVINFLGGHKEKFNYLVTKAMQINGDLSCPRCGRLMIEAKIGNKNYKEDIKLCTSCGLVCGKTVGNIRGYKAC